jgi:hypothetical protein
MVQVSCANELNPVQYYLRELNAGELLREAQLQLFIGHQKAPLAPPLLVASPPGLVWGAERGFSTSLAI